MKAINNKNMVWIATASLIYPSITSSKLVTAIQIKDEISRLFHGADNATTTSIQITRHLVSWRDRDADKTNGRRGGDRSRFLFQTLNGKTPSDIGKYRLYKKVDALYDGKDKTGTAHPAKRDVLPEYHYLIDWYVKSYIEN